MLYRIDARLYGNQNLEVKYANIHESDTFKRVFANKAEMLSNKSEPEKAAKEEYLICLG